MGRMIVKKVKGGEYLAIDTRTGGVKARGRDEATVREFARQWMRRQRKRALKKRD